MLAPHVQENLSLSLSLIKVFYVVVVDTSSFSLLLYVCEEAPTQTAGGANFYFPPALPSTIQLRTNRAQRALGSVRRRVFVRRRH